MKEQLNPTVLEQITDQNGASVAEHNRRAPLLIVFLRHTGCTFCREAVADLRRDREAIEAQGVTPALVHMVSDEAARKFVAKYGMEDIPRFADPQKRLYKEFDLRRGSFNQLLGVKSWTRGFKAGLIDGHGVGSIGGDPFQMPGAFLIHNDRIVRAFRHETAADRPDYVGMASCPVDSSEECAVA